MPYKISYIGKRIKEYREKDRLKVVMLADQIDCCPSTLYDIEHGYTIPNYVTLTRLAKAFCISISELVQGDDARNYYDRNTQGR